MQHRALTADMFRQLVVNETELNVLRIHYCYQIGSTFVTLSNLEESIIGIMLMCDRIRVASVLGEDAAAWQRLVEKDSNLKNSTLGNLITILAKHGIQASDLAYLRWVKGKRDFFIHRFFHQHQWPGELNQQGVAVMCRRLLYLEAIFARASNRMSKIFANAGLLTIIDLGRDGALLMNPEIDL